MISIFVLCSACLNIRLEVSGVCRACDGLGRVFAPGAPSFGCSVTLADRWPGEIVTLGNGDRVKILWHMPRKKPKQVPETTFLDILDPFTELESYRPVPYPSSIGVSAVDVSREPTDMKTHERERSVDISDPLRKRKAM